jgi:hybrid cluster-associated redox disulfide protein
MINVSRRQPFLFALPQAHSRTLFASVFVPAQREFGRMVHTGSMNTIALTSDMMVDDVMTRWPATIRVFLDHHMKCVGCPIAPFHSIADATGEHELNAASFLSALKNAV